jgi:hypothetical protein
VVQFFYQEWTLTYIIISNTALTIMLSFTVWSSLYTIANELFFNDSMESLRESDRFHSIVSYATSLLRYTVTMA